MASLSSSRVTTDMSHRLQDKPTAEHRVPGRTGRGRGAGRGVGFLVGRIFRGGTSLSLATTETPPPDGSAKRRLAVGDNKYFSFSSTSPS